MSTCKICGKQTEMPFHTCKRPSQIAVECEAELLRTRNTEVKWRLDIIQSAIDKATEELKREAFVEASNVNAMLAKMVPIEDVRPLLKGHMVAIGDSVISAHPRDAVTAFLALHGEKLKATSPLPKATSPQS